MFNRITSERPKHYTSADIPMYVHRLDGEYIDSSLAVFNRGRYYKVYNPKVLTFNSEQKLKVFTYHILSEKDITMITYELFFNGNNLYHVYHRKAQRSEQLSQNTHNVCRMLCETDDVPMVLEYAKSVIQMDEL